MEKMPNGVVLASGFRAMAITYTPYTHGTPSYVNH